MKKSLRFFACILVLSLCIGPAIAATPVVTPKASLYLSSYTAITSATGGGRIGVFFDAAATSLMTQIGASHIVIQEKRGTVWYGIKIFNASTTPGMLATNTSYHSNTIVYSGTAGTQYRAVVTIYAANSSGSDFRTVTTNAVTAY